MQVQKLLSDAAGRLHIHTANFKLIHALHTQAKVSSRLFTKMYSNISRHASYFWYYEALFELASSTITATEELEHEMETHIRKKCKELEELQTIFTKKEKEMDLSVKEERELEFCVDVENEELLSMAKINQLSPSEKYEELIQKAEEREQRLSEQLINYRSRLEEQEHEFEQFSEEIAKQVHALFTEIMRVEQRFHEILGGIETFQHFKEEIERRKPIEEQRACVEPKEAENTIPNEERAIEAGQSMEYEPDFRQDTTGAFAEHGASSFEEM